MAARSSRAGGTNQIRFASLIGDAYTERISYLRAKVIDGRFVLDEPTSLPDGTTLDLVLDDEGDDPTPAERKVLDDAIVRAWASARAGKLRPADQVITELRARA